MLIDYETFHLMEGGRMGRIHRIGTEYASRTNHPKRRLMCLHISCLHGGSLGSQEDIAVDIEGILLIPRRMSFRNIQLLKIVAVILYLRSFHHLIAHSGENLLHLFERQGVRMRMPVANLLSRKGHVDGLRKESLVL